MAILWVDNFDPYADDYIQFFDNWYGVNAAVTDWYWFPTDARSRSGTWCFARGWIDGAVRARRAIGQSLVTVGTGLAYYTTALPRRSRDTVIFGFEDASFNSTIGILLESTGAIAVLRGHSHHATAQDGTILDRTGPGVIRARTWHHIEIKCTLDASVGAVEIRVDGDQVIALSNINTVPSTAELGGAGPATAETSYISLWGGPNNSGSSGGYGGHQIEYMYIDDIVVWDTSGSYNNDFIGDHIIDNLLPSGDTAQADFTALSGNPYQNIDEMPGMDAGETYIYAGTPGSPSEYSSEFDVGNLNSTSGTIAAVVVATKFRKDTADQVDYQGGIVSGASESKGTTTEAIARYHYQEDVFETDPSSGVAFTPTEVNSVKIQVNRVT